MIWYGTNKDIDDWFKKIFKTKNKSPDEFILNISEDDIE